MRKFKKLTMTLAALITAATGAWAQGIEPVADPNAITVNTVTKGKQWTFTMPASNVELQVEYEPEFTATFKAGNANTIQGGKATVTESGATEGTDVTANIGTDNKLTPVYEGQTITLTAAPGYKFKSVEAKKAVVPKEFVEFTSGTKKVKFANMNLGATSVADGTTSYGDYYAWGATETFATVDYSTATPTVTVTKEGGYSQDNGPYYSGGTYSKYNSTDNRITLEAADDAVTAKMGEGYRMPTSEDFQTLYAACGGTGDHMEPSSISSGAAYSQGIYWVEGATSAVTIGGDEYKANGVLFVQDATHHIFFPAAGEFNGTSLKFAGVVGNCWSSSFYTADANRAHYLFLNSVYVSPVDNYLRYRGYPVRPVQVTE